MGKKRECPNCKKEVEIIELIPIQDEPGHFKQMLTVDIVSNSLMLK